jgi:hypothetical protein
MLSALDGVVGIDDPHLGHHLGVWRPIPLAWSTAEHPPQPGLLSEVKRSKPSYFFSDRYREHWMPALRRLIGERFGAQVSELRGDRRPIPLTIVKEPGSQVASWITSMFPGSFLIFLARDGRDVVDSWLDAHDEGSWGMDEGMYPLADDGRLPFIRWQSSVWRYRIEAVQAAYDRHAPGRRAFVRYEELRRDPAAALARLCAALGVDGVSAAGVAAVASHLSYERVPPTAKGNGHRIRRAEPGGWRDRMSPEEIEAMEEIMAPTLAALGYLEASADDNRTRLAAPVPIGGWGDPLAERHLLSGARNGSRR